MRKPTRVMLFAAALTIFIDSNVDAAPKKKEPPQVVQLLVTEKGFEPASITLKTGSPIQLVVTRTTDATCAKEIVLKELGIRRALPLNDPQTLQISKKQIGKSKKLTFLCGMDMLSGEIVLE